jgi:magnesium chelatase subunit I
MRKKSEQISKPAAASRAFAPRKANGSAAARRAYPFAAIVGQEEMKLALMLSVVDPHIGGVIVMGHRGTGKSTAVRALAELLPPIVRVKGCSYGCDPERAVEFCDDCQVKSSRPRRLPVEQGPVHVVDLPLGATEDRVCGTLDIERALVEGVKAFEPGLLARANRGFLYIDEVNLLDDHLVDVLLDAAASGRNVVEREGISISHPARFVLVGSGNPEEGELRPQLLDRFGLYTQISTITDLDQRVEIVERRERFERDAESFFNEIESEHDGLRRRLVRAKNMYSRVQIERGLLRRIAELCIKLQVDGHRGELTISRAARALAALEGRASATIDDVKRVAVMSLRHRLRKDPLERIDSGLRIEQALESVFPSIESDGKLTAIR